MGARTPSTLRPRRGAIKCEYCGRSLGSPEALKSHQNTLHATALKRKEKLKICFKKLSRPLANKLKGKIGVAQAEKVAKRVVTSKVLKTAKKTRPATNGVQNSATVSKVSLKCANNANKPQKTIRKPLKESNGVVSSAKVKPKKSLKPVDSVPETATPAPEMDDNQIGSVDKAVVRRKIEFKCPKCDKEFPISFKALRHIQKYHCENSEGVEVEPDSPDLIQPIQIELCPHCEDKFTGEHNCPQAPKKRKISQDAISVTSVVGPYGCIACHKSFERLTIFQKHVTSMHNDGLESMLFPTIGEFETWRNEMQSHTSTLYISVGKNNSKHYYQCSSSLNDQSNGTFSCPSLIIYQSYPKGIQVHFYKYHFGHDYKQYCMEDTYKNYSISDLLVSEPLLLKVKKEEPETEEETEEDQSDILDEDLYLKFKTLMENIIMDASKVNMDTLKVLANKALDMNTVVEQYNDNSDVDRSSVASYPSPRSDYSKRKPDTSITSPLRQKLRMAIRKAAAHKSPILTFNKTKHNTFSLANDKDSEKIMNELNENKNTESKDNTTKHILSTPPRKLPITTTNDDSPSSFSESYQHFISKVSKNERKQKLVARNESPQKKSRRSEKIKTKMGQYNPDSPKKGSPKTLSSPKKGKARLQTAKGGPKSKRKKGRVAKDFKYEVMERDDDCNILILKI